MGPCAVVCDWLWRKSLRLGESAYDAEVKRSVVPVQVFVQLLLTAHVVQISIRRKELGVFDVGIGILFLVHCYILAAWFVYKTPARTCMKWFTYSSVLPILLLDLAGAASVTVRCWTLSVLVMDLLLVFSLPGQEVIIAVVLAYLALERTNNTVDYGLYDAVMIRGDLEVPVCDCAEPPCTNSLSHNLGAWTFYVCVFLADFKFTRGFAVGMQQQMDLVRASVEAAGRVSAMLASYDVAAAKEELEGTADSLPPDLLHALRALLFNLEAYRPYLPETLLPSSHGEAHRASRPPGVDGADPVVTVCFTDVQASTALWQSFPQGMFDALGMHNAVLRAECSQYDGYEVKTIGDAFMVAFQSADHACGFSMAVQSGLLLQPWPADLAQHPLCCRQQTTSGTTLWHGLRVRIGMHCGPVRVERNPVTLRCDYFGTTVNVASRIEATLKDGGLTGVSAVLLDSVGRDTLADADVQFLGNRELKGVPGVTPVYTVLPAALALRGQEQWRDALKVDLPGSTCTPIRGSFTDHTLPRSSVGSTPSTPSTQAQRSKAAPTRALNLGLSVGQMTCTCIRISQPPDATDAQVEEVSGLALASISVAADASRGELQQVLSCTAVVVWSASKNSEHARSCKRFLELTALDSPLQLRSGSATGEALSGNIAAGRRRFASVAGGCVDLALMLSQEAELCDDAALAAGDVVEAFRKAPASGNPAEVPRCAQLWYRPGGPSFVVWEIPPCVRSLEEEASWADASDVAECTRARFEEVFRKVADAAPEDREVLLDRCDSPHAHHLRRRVARGGVRRRAVPPLWGLSGLPTGGDERAAAVKGPL